VIPSSDLDNWISNDNIMYTWINDSLPLKRKLHTITKMNDNIDMDSKIAGSMNA